MEVLGLVLIRRGRREESLYRGEGGDFGREWDCPFPGCAQ